MVTYDPTTCIITCTDGRKIVAQGHRSAGQTAEAFAQQMPTSTLVEIDGHRIAITHGDAHEIY